MSLTDRPATNEYALNGIRDENKRVLRWIVLAASPFVLIAAIMASRSLVEYLEVRTAVKASVGEDQILAFGKMTEHGWSDRCISVEINLQIEPLPSGKQFMCWVALKVETGVLITCTQIIKNAGYMQRASASHLILPELVSGRGTAAAGGGGGACDV